MRSAGLDLSAADHMRAQAVELRGLTFDVRGLSFKLGPFGIAAPRPEPGGLIVPFSGAVVSLRGLVIGDDV